MKKQSFKLFSLVLFVTTFIFSSCSLEVEPLVSDDDSGNSLELATISGVVVSPKGKAVRSATVEVVGNEKYNSITDTEGKFSFEVPTGEHTLKIYTGSGEVFNSSKSVEVEAKTNNSIGNIELSVAPQTRIAYVWGEYDNIQSIISNSLGYQIDSLSHSDMEDINNLRKYDVIFLNCGESGQGRMDGYSEQISTQEEMDVIRQNIGDYVAEGGKIYASDYAVGYVVPQCDSDFNYYLEFNNTLFSADILCFNLNGEVETVVANVIDKDLANIIGEEANIIYDLGEWATIIPAQNFAGNVLVEGDNSSVLAFSQNIGSGQILYTTFHNEANISDDMEAILEFFIYNF